MLGTEEYRAKCKSAENKFRTIEIYRQIKQGYGKMHECVCREKMMDSLL